MSHDAGEVSWQTLRRIVQQWCGDSAEIGQITPLAGGSISTTLLLETKRGDRSVLKLSPHRVDRSYLKEAYQLDLLRSIGLPTPRVYECHIGHLDAPDSWLLIECIPGANLHEARPKCPTDQFERVQHQLADIAVAMHRVMSPFYGRVAPSASEMHDSWPKFFRSIYDPIWKEAEKAPHLSVRAARTIQKVHDRLEHYLAHDDRPRLTHGDLWSSNVMVEEVDGQWRVSGLLDPNCTWAHAECELAYLDLFQTSTNAFARQYQRAFALSADYHNVRKPVYQLYELLNNVQLYGEKYLKPLAATVEKVSALV